MLSFAGRCTLVKHGSSAIPIYLFSLFRAPSYFCQSGVWTYGAFFYGEREEILVYIGGVKELFHSSPLAAEFSACWEGLKWGFAHNITRLKIHSNRPSPKARQLKGLQSRKPHVIHSLFNQTLSLPLGHTHFSLISV